MPARRFRVVAVVGLLAATAAGCGGGAPAPAPTAADRAAISDGRHFGYLRAVDTEDPVRLTFDEAEFLTGDAGLEAARADGFIAPGEPLPNDYYIRNPSRATARIPVGRDVAVTTVTCRDGCRDIPGDLAGLLRSFTDPPSEPSLLDEYRGAASQYWITIRSGEVVAIEEQYLP